MPGLGEQGTGPVQDGTPAPAAGNPAAVPELGLEALDGEGWLEPAELARNLDDLAAAKRWLGCYAEVWQLLQPALPPGAGRNLVVLDVATGGADLPHALAQRAARAGLAWQVLGLDRHPQVAAEARRRLVHEPRVGIVRGDGLALPLASGAVDVALCSLSLHHFAWPQARRLLAEMQRVARHGVLVTDFVRSRRAYWAAWAATRIVGARHRLTRRDGPLSIQRAYTPGEVWRLAMEAGLAQPVLLRRIPFRVTLLSPGPAFGR